MSLTDIIKNSINLSDKADDNYVRFFGNRTTVLGYVIGSYGFAFGLQGIFTGGALGILAFILGGATLVASKAVAELYTNYGRSTFEYYKRTERHIKKSGKLKKRFLKILMTKDCENTKYLGYCEIQGAYLAAKKYGQLDVFKEVKKKYSHNVIPNF